MTDIPKMLRSEALIADEDWTGIYQISPDLAFAAASRIEKLEAALRPFAKWADWHDDAKGTDVERCFSKAQITVGELRAARKALEGEDD